MNKANTEQLNIFANSKYEIWGNIITLKDGKYRDDTGQATIKRAEIY